MRANVYSLFSRSVHLAALCTQCASIRPAPSSPRAALTTRSNSGQLTGVRCLFTDLCGDAGIFGASSCCSTIRRTTTRSTALTSTPQESSSSPPQTTLRSRSGSGRTLLSHNIAAAIRFGICARATCCTRSTRTKAPRSASRSRLQGQFNAAAMYAEQRLFARVTCSDYFASAGHDQRVMTWRSNLEKIPTAGARFILGCWSVVLCRRGCRCSWPRQRAKIAELTVRAIACSIARFS
mgnify:FL=1